ncbi:MAG: hypothetical protein ABFS46_10090 [Myxococcota bacterium]
MAEEEGGGEKSKLKERIRALKGERDTALAGRDAVQLKRLRRRIHKLKRQLRRSAS